MESMQILSRHHEAAGKLRSRTLAQGGGARSRWRQFGVRDGLRIPTSLGLEGGLSVGDSGTTSQDFRSAT